MEPENQKKKQKNRWVWRRGASESPDRVVSAEQGCARPVIQGGIEFPGSVALISGALVAAVRDVPVDKLRQQPAFVQRGGEPCGRGTPAGLLEVSLGEAGLVRVPLLGVIPCACRVGAGKNTTGREENPPRRGTKQGGARLPVQPRCRWKLPSA